MTFEKHLDQISTDDIAKAFGLPKTWHKDNAEAQATATLEYGGKMQFTRTGLIHIYWKKTAGSRNYTVCRKPISTDKLEVDAKENVTCDMCNTLFARYLAGDL